MPSIYIENMARFATCKTLFKGIIIGPPGSGKGTISSRIVRDFGVKHIASGDLLRKQIQEKTVLGQEAEKFIKNGSLVPDDLMIKLILTQLSIDGKGAPWLLDGFPRTVPQAEALSAQHMLSAVINLDVPFEEIIQRIKGRWVHAPSGRVYHMQFNPPKVAGFDDVTGEPLIQRDDDKPETVKSRLEHYQNETEPVLEYYRKAGLLTEFQGTESNEIWPRVRTFLGTIISPKSAL